MTLLESIFSYSKFRWRSFNNVWMKLGPAYILLWRKEANENVGNLISPLPTEPYNTRSRRIFISLSRGQTLFSQKSSVIICRKYRRWDLSHCSIRRGFFKIVNSPLFLAITSHYCVLIYKKYF